MGSQRVGKYSFVTGEGNGNPFQYSYPENPMDRGAWWATVHGITESDMTEQLTHVHWTKDSIKEKKKNTAKPLTLRRLTILLEEEEENIVIRLESKNF